MDLEVLVTLRGKKQHKPSPNDTAGRLTTLDSLATRLRGKVKVSASVVFSAPEAAGSASSWPLCHEVRVQLAFHEGHIVHIRCVSQKHCNVAARRGATAPLKPPVRLFLSNTPSLIGPTLMTTCHNDESLRQT